MTKDIRADLRRTVAEISELQQLRDQLIREGLAGGVKAADLAADAGLSVFRIYQIRDGRR